MTEPSYSCAACGASVMVDRYARGFPPDAAKRKLIRACAAEGHKAEPVYRAGLIIGPRAGGQ